MGRRRCDRQPLVAALARIATSRCSRRRRGAAAGRRGGLRASAENVPGTAERRRRSTHQRRQPVTMRAYLEAGATTICLSTIRRGQSRWRYRWRATKRPLGRSLAYREGDYRRSKANSATGDCGRRGPSPGADAAALQYRCAALPHATLAGGRDEAEQRGSAGLGAAPWPRSSIGCEAWTWSGRTPNYKIPASNCWDPAVDGRLDARAERRRRD